MFRLRPKTIFLSMMVAASFFIIINNIKLYGQKLLNNTELESNCMRDPIDAVYTWVNGSDPDFQAVMAKYKSDDEVKESEKRFNDWGTLKYSIRSIGMYAPWIRNIFIVTNGQVPNWLKITDRMKIITHKQIFEDEDDLPTFSSRAIELYIHRIPGLSDKFIYINDDMFIGNHLKKEDLCHGKNGQKIYHSYYKTSHCAYGCWHKWLGDGICQEVCNNSLCLNDKGDCLKPNVKTLDRKQAYAPLIKNNWYYSITRWNIIFNRDFGFAERLYPMHQAYLIDKHVKEAFNSKYRDEVAKAAKNKFRTQMDIQFQFSYGSFLVETGRRSKSAGNLRYEFEEVDDKPYAALGFFVNDAEQTAQILNRTYFKWRSGKPGELPTFLCFSDGTDNPPDSEKLQKVVTEFFERAFYVKSMFEI